MSDTYKCRCCGREIQKEYRFCPWCREEIRTPEDHEYMNYGKCPCCGSSHVKVSATAKPFRTLVCIACGRSYTTAELIMIHNDVFEIAEAISARQVGKR